MPGLRYVEQLIGLVTPKICSVAHPSRDGTGFYIVLELVNTSGHPCVQFVGPHMNMKIYGGTRVNVYAAFIRRARRTAQHLCVLFVRHGVKGRVQMSCEVEFVRLAIELYDEFP